MVQVRRPVSTDRRGAVLVEFAIIAPLIFLLFAGFVEFCRFHVTRHSVGEISYEACRAGIVMGATTANVRSVANSLARANGLRNAQIVVTPAVIGPNTEEVTVRVRVPTASNFWIAPRFFRNSTVEAQTTLDHENKIYLRRRQ